LETNKFKLKKDTFLKAMGRKYKNASLYFGRSFSTRHKEINWNNNFLESLFLTIFPLSGIGLGLISSPAVFLPHLYFEKRLKSAIAISSCGPCFGILCFAPFATWLEETYGWRVAHLNISVIVLFCCVSMEAIVLN